MAPTTAPAQAGRGRPAPPVKQARAGGADGAKVSPNSPVAVRIGAPITVGQTTFELRG